MCEPTTIALVASMAIAAVGSMQQAKAANDAAKYEQQVQQNNNVMAARAQEDTIQRGKREETLRRMQTGQDVGAAKSSLAASGFNVNTGSALTMQSDIKGQGDIEALTIRNNAAREAYGVGVDNYSDRANSRSKIAGFKNEATSSLISGASSVASMGYQGYKSGTFGKKPTTTTTKGGFTGRALHK